MDGFLLLKLLLKEDPEGLPRRGGHLLVRVGGGDLGLLRVVRVAREVRDHGGVPGRLYTCVMARLRYLVKNHLLLKLLAE